MIETLPQMRALPPFAPPRMSPLVPAASSALESVAGSEQDLLELSAQDVDGVLARGSSALLSYQSEDARWRTRRAHYVYANDVLYMPSTNLGELFEHGVTRPVECDVSELAGLNYWRYVRAVGAAILLQPTGAAAEREAWKKGMERFKLILLESRTLQDLAFGNIGIVQVDVERKTGWLRVLQ